MFDNHKAAPTHQLEPLLFLLLQLRLHALALRQDSGGGLYKGAEQRLGKLVQGRWSFAWLRQQAAVAGRGSTGTRRRTPRDMAAARCRSRRRRRRALRPAQPAWRLHCRRAALPAGCQLHDQLLTFLMRSSSASSCSLTCRYDLHCRYRDVPSTAGCRQTGIIHEPAAACSQAGSHE